MLSVRRNYNRNGLTNCFLRSVAEDSLGPPVPARDDTLEVLADNCVVTALDDLPKEKRLQLLFPKCCFDFLMLGNIPIYFKHSVAS